MENNTLSKADFNLDKKHEMFDVIYSISKDVFDNTVKAWTVIGHVLNSSSDKRCFETELCSHPISIFVVQNQYSTLSKLRGDIVSTNREEVVEHKKALLNEFFNEQLTKLK